MSHTLMAEGQWNYFFHELEGPNGCDFKQTDPEDAGTITWRCKGGMDKTYALEILTKMELPEATVSGVLTYVESLGGHCDCEILFNAVDRIYEHIDREKAPA